MIRFVEDFRLFRTLQRKFECQFTKALRQFAGTGHLNGAAQQLKWFN